MIDQLDFVEETTKQKRKQDELQNGWHLLTMKIKGTENRVEVKASRLKVRAETNTTFLQTGPLLHANDVMERKSACTLK